MSTLKDFFSQFQFAPVIDLPEGYEVYDFTSGYDSDRALASKYGVGRYNEKRRGMYTTELFVADDLSNARDIHVGIDIAAPVFTEVRAFFDGTIYLAGINPADGDYGGTLITEHCLGPRKIWALHGHLSHASIANKISGARIYRGDVIAWLGDKTENGGWNPHLHFQLSWQRPEKCDLPGAVSDLNREAALNLYPDPQFVLGQLY